MVTKFADDPQNQTDAGMNQNQNQTKPNQTKPNQNQTKLNQTKTKLIQPESGVKMVNDGETCQAHLLLPKVFTPEELQLKIRKFELK